MKNFIRHIIRHTSNIMPGSIQKKDNHPPTIVLYHTIENHQPSFITGYKVKSVDAFREDLEFLLKHYKPVSLEEITRQTNQKDSIHFSFDDGLKSCYTNIAPILKEKGIPASFFINPTFVNNDKIYHRFTYELLKTSESNLSSKYRNYENSKSLEEIAKSKGFDIEEWSLKNNPYMTLEEIKSLHNDGFLIGGHSMDHPEFYKISFEEQYKQIEKSMEWVNEHINPSIKAFAFPYTDHGISNKLLEKAKNKNIIDISLGTAGLKHDVFPSHFQRIPMEPKSLNTAIQIFKYEHFYYKIRAILGGNTVHRN